MSIYQNQLESIVADIESTVNDLNSYVDSANSATTRATFDKYVALYDTANLSYDELLGQYDIAKENLERYNTYNIVSTEEIDIPNAQDKTQWYAGGLLRNESFAGGIGFSPTSVPAFQNKAKGNDFASNMISGTFDFLNPAWSSIVALNNIGYFNLLHDNDKRTTSVYRVNIAIIGYDEAGNAFVGGEGEGEIYTSSNSDKDYTNNNTNISSVDKVVSNNWNMFTTIEAITAGNKISLAISAIDMLTNEKFAEMSTGEILSAGVYGAVRSLFSSALSGALGLGMIGSLVIGAVFDELVELSLGIDNSFGIGGQMTYSPTGTKMFGEAEGFLGIETGFKSLENMFANSFIGGLFYNDFEVVNAVNFTDYEKTTELARTFNYVGFSRTDYFSSVGARSVEQTRYSTPNETYDMFSNGWSVYTDTVTKETYTYTPDNTYIQSDRYGNVISTNAKDVEVTKNTEMATSLNNQLDVVAKNTVELNLFEMMYEAFTSPEAVANAGNMYASSVNSVLGVDMYEYNTITGNLQLTDYYDPMSREIDRISQEFEDMKSNFSDSSGDGASLAEQASNSEQVGDTSGMEDSGSGLGIA